MTFNKLFLQTRCCPEGVVLVHEVVERFTELSCLAILLTNGPRLQRVDANVCHFGTTSIHKLFKVPLKLKSRILEILILVFVAQSLIDVWNLEFALFEHYIGFTFIKHSTLSAFDDSA